MKRIFDINRRYVYLAVFTAVTIMVQAFFMYKTTISPKKRNLIVITKSPIQVIGKWDNPDLYNKHPVCMTDNIIKILDTMHETEFKDYKFNDNIYVRVDTTDTKIDNADISLKEVSDLVKGMTTSGGNDVKSKIYP